MSHMDMMKKNLIIIFGIIGLIFSITFILTFVLLFFISPSSEPKTTGRINEYLLTEINPSERTIKKGFTELPQSLGQEDYIAFHNEVGSSFIITNFGGTNYKCSGSCSCTEVEDSRRSPTTVLSRGLLVLFSAFSVSMATKIAQETFRHQCVEKYSSHCSSENIESEVEHCEEEQSNSESSQTSGSSEGMYLCKGYCIKAGEGMGKDGKSTPIPPMMEQAAMKKIGLCENLRLEKQVQLGSQHFYQYETNYGKMTDDFSRVAEAFFLEKHLFDFCRDNSYVGNEDIPNEVTKAMKQIVELMENNKDFQEGNPLQKLFGEKASQEALARMKKDVEIGGIPYCMAGQYGMGENIKCVSVSEENPGWEGWGEGKGGGSESSGLH